MNITYLLNPLNAILKGKIREKKVDLSTIAFKKREMQKVLKNTCTRVEHGK